MPYGLLSRHLLCSEHFSRISLFIPKAYIKKKTPQNPLLSLHPPLPLSPSPPSVMEHIASNPIIMLNTLLVIPNLIRHIQIVRRILNMQIIPIEVLLNIRARMARLDDEVPLRADFVGGEAGPVILGVVGGAVDVEGAVLFAFVAVLGEYVDLCARSSTRV